MVTTMFWIAPNEVELNNDDSKGFLSEQIFSQWLPAWSPLQAGLASEDAKFQPRWEDVGVSFRRSLHRHRRGGDRWVINLYQPGSEFENTFLITWGLCTLPRREPDSVHCIVKVEFLWHHATQWKKAQLFQSANISLHIKYVNSPFYVTLQRPEIQDSKFYLSHVCSEM